MPGVQMWKGMLMWKGVKMGKKVRNERRRKSGELTPPTPPLNLWETSPATDLALKTFLHRCPKEVKEINILLVHSLAKLVNNGIITDPNNLLRSEESFKQSWDMGLLGPEFYYELLNSKNVIWRDPSQKEEVERYLNFAAKNKYFDVPDPKDRPVGMYRGFYFIYPEGQEQKDPIFGTTPDYAKFIPLISKLGMAAVEYHNFMTDSDLEFSELKKANLFLEICRHAFYITFEATDKLSGKKVTCQSKVTCSVDFADLRGFIRDTVVESFHRFEIKPLTNGEDEDDESGDEDEKEETPKKVEPAVKKKAADSATKTPAPDKKANFVSPQKSDGKKVSGHVATPYQTKKSEKKSSISSDRKKDATPKGSVTCTTCSRSFGTDKALESHSKAKHGSA